MSNYNELVADIKLAIEKFSEIVESQKDTVFYGASEYDQAHASGSVSAYRNVIGVLNLLIEKED